MIVVDVVKMKCTLVMYYVTHLTNCIYPAKPLLCPAPASRARRRSSYNEEETESSSSTTSSTSLSSPHFRLSSARIMKDNYGAPPPVSLSPLNFCLPLTHSCDDNRPPTRARIRITTKVPRMEDTASTRRRRGIPNSKAIHLKGKLSEL